MGHHNKGLQCNALEAFVVPPIFRKSELCKFPWNLPEPAAMPSLGALLHNAAGLSSDSPMGHQKSITTKVVMLFYPSRQAWYVIDARSAADVIRPLGGMASRPWRGYPGGLITSNLRLMPCCLAADSMPQQVADAIHGFTVIWERAAFAFF